MAMPLNAWVSTSGAWPMTLKRRGCRATARTITFTFKTDRFNSGHALYPRARASALPWGHSACAGLTEANRLFDTRRLLFTTPSIRMNSNNRDDLRRRKPASPIEARRFRASDQEKQRQADDLKRRFARYSSGTSRVAWLKRPGPRWGRWALAVLVAVYLLWVVLA